MNRQLIVLLFSVDGTKAKPVKSLSRPHPPLFRARRAGPSGLQACESFHFVKITHNVTSRPVGVVSPVMLCADGKVNSGRPVGVVSPALLRVDGKVNSGHRLVGVVSPVRLCADGKVNSGPVGDVSHEH